MATVEVQCPYCKEKDVVKNGKNANGIQKYQCRNIGCKRYFTLEYTYKGAKPGINEQIIKMAANASGVRNTARVLGVSTVKVMSTLKNVQTGNKIYS